MPAEHWQALDDLVEISQGMDVPMTADEFLASAVFLIVSDLMKESFRGLKR